jgi:ADP-ribose pyrophosphatase YjhB (NUDIX family)
MLFAVDASAISINAIYRSACERDLGVIIDVDKRELTLLGLDGQVRKIPRYEVVSIAYYPASHVDIDPERVQPVQPAMRVGTLQDGRLVGLVDGWPVDFNEERIAFVSLDGREVLVGRDRIWSLEYLEQLPPRARPKRHQKLTFVHPHAVGFCNEATPDPSARALYPQQFINDGVVIKRELDRLMEGHQGVREYERDQIFYPVPQVYRERTVLGLWTSHGQKHGATPGRPNNFTPVLTDQVSLGPFRYQHILVTGAAPMPFSVHTEVQTQLYYRFKAAYFHASAMFDPNLLMVGDEYFGSASDLASTYPDLRTWEFLMVEFGFDWGPLALQLSPGAGAIVAARAGDYFDSTDLAVFRFGPRFRFVSWMAEAWFGFSERDREMPLRWARLNAWFDYDENLRISASLLARQTDLWLYPDYPQEPWRITDRAYAGCAEARYTLLHRYDFGARVSVETAATRARTETNAPLDQGRTTHLIGSWYVGLSF